MRGTIKVPFGVYYNEQFSRPFRRKQDIVLFILNAVNVLLIQQQYSEIKGTLWIKKEKMSRVFCFLEGKYFSTVFPFEIEQKSGTENAFKVYDSTWDIEIDNRRISLLERMLDRIDFEQNSVEAIIESAYLDVAEDDYTNEEVDQCFGLILRLLSMELGYIRYDYDPDHENGAYHPLHHLDINYSSKGTYKLGVSKKVEMDEFIDLLDVKTACRYVQEK